MTVGGLSKSKPRAGEWTDTGLLFPTGRDGMFAPLLFRLLA
jgi:hypothetical protein